MAHMGTGALLVFNAVAAADQADFNEWYDREHLDERLALPGFLRARRYIAERGRPQHFAFYETEQVTDLARPEYLDILANGTPLSSRVVAAFTAFIRLTCRVTVDCRHGMGSALAICRATPDPDREAAFRGWLDADACPRWAARPGLVGAALFENDPVIQATPNDPSDGPAEWAIMLEGSDDAATWDAARDLGQRPEFRAAVPGEVDWALYRFLYGVSR